jgi:hypothetical protein
VVDFARSGGLVSAGQRGKMLLKVVAEAIGPVMASFELGPCNLAERDSLRPESSQEHPPGSIAGVLRLRA